MDDIVAHLFGVLDIDSKFYMGAHSSIIGVCQMQSLALIRFSNHRVLQSTTTHIGRYQPSHVDIL